MSDSVLNEFKNYDDLLSAKKITGSDVSFVTKKKLDNRYNIRYLQTRL